jgi:pimeloyl-ACP methyl ester carboxylesterase
MQRLRVDGVELEYQAEGVGEPVVLIHGGVLTDGLSPLASEPALAKQHRVISYHRVGYAGSSRAQGDVEIVDQAAHCLALLHHLDVEQAHVVGHSSGAMIALQLAHDAPDSVATLALLELPDFQLPSSADFGQTVLGPSFQRYGGGDKAGAVDSFMRGVCGPSSWEAGKHALPEGALDQATVDADTFFGVEAPSTQRWQLEEAASGVAAPVLVVMGALSPEVHPVYTEAHDAMLRRFPQAESYVLPEATHLLQLQNPGDLAAALAGFIGRHRLNGPS